MPKQKSAAPASRKLNRSLEYIELLDSFKHSCSNIATVAQLLETYGRYPGAEAIGDNVVGNAGAMIGNEVDRMRLMADKLESFL